MSEIHSDAAPYVLGALDAEEMAAFESHLDTCSECQAEIKLLGEALTMMAYADAEAPPPQVREKVLAAIESEESSGVVELRPRRSLSRYLIPAVAAVVLLSWATVAIFGENPVDEVLAAPDAVDIELTATDAYTDQVPVLARVVFSDSENAAVVEFAGLPTPPANMTYQLWLLDDDGRGSAGTFRPDRNGAATVRLDAEARSGQTVGITQEPSGGSPAPTGDVLFFAEL